MTKSEVISRRELASLIRPLMNPLLLFGVHVDGFPREGDPKLRNPDTSYMPI